MTLLLQTWYNKEYAKDCLAAMEEMSCDDFSSGLPSRVRMCTRRVTIRVFPYYKVFAIDLGDDAKAFSQWANDIEHNDIMHVQT